MVILQNIPSTPLLYYHFMFFFIKLNCFSHEITNIINALLCLVRYLLFANTLYPDKRCFTVSFCWPHSLHLLHLVSPPEAFHDFVSTIYPTKIITEAFFIGVKLFLSHKLQLLSCFRNISLCICFSRYSSFRFSSTPFFNFPLLHSILVLDLFQSFLYLVRCHLVENLLLSLLHALM